MAVADLTGDGKLDVVTTNALQNTVTVQLGNGDGTFEPGQTVAVGPAPTPWRWPTSTATAGPTW